MPNETKPKSLKRDHLVVEELGTELMIYDQTRNQAFCLNQKAAFVWQHCDGKSSVSAIAALMETVLGEPTDEKVVEYALQSLSNDGLLESSMGLTFVPEGMTRRDVIHKLGVRAAVALPLVTALLVATPRAHASSTNGGGGGKKHRW